MYGRNELVARYIKIRTGKVRTRKQVSSHLQVLTKRHSKELQSLRNDKQAQQIIWNRLKQSTSIEMECSSANETPAVCIPNQNELEIASTSVSRSAPGLTAVKNLLLDDSIPFDPSLTTVDELILSSIDAYSNAETHPTYNTSLSQPLMSLDISSTPCSSQVNKFSVSNFLPSKTVAIRRLSERYIHRDYFILSASPKFYSYGTDRSRCSSNSSVSSYSLGSINTRLLNPLIRPIPMIGDVTFRLVDLSAFVELKRTSQSSPFYPYAEICSIHQQDLVRLHANDIQMKNIQAFETISIDQISDKFPAQDGLKDLFEHHPHGSFFLIKSWADVSCSSASLGNPILNRDESFFTSYTYTSCSYQPIQISTRLCSFGKQILEKVEISEYPQQDQFDQFIYRFDRSPLCDYMVQFIQKLRSLPNTAMMNSVLEVRRRISQTTAIH